MPALSEDYVLFRDNVVNGASFTEEELKNIVRSFESEINSKRRTDYINSFAELIKVLEKRGYLGENKVDSFSRFDRIVPNINEMMTRYLQSRTTRHRTNTTNPGGNTSLPAYTRFQSVNSSRSTSSATSTLSEDILPKAVVERVVQDIGSHWRDLARGLDIREGDIDEIEYRYPRNLRERARECIKRFLRETDPYMVRYKLLAALDECQRRDIKEQVEEILSRRPF